MTDRNMQPRTTPHPPIACLKYGLVFALVGALVSTNYWVMSSLSNIPYRLGMLSLFICCVVDASARRSLLSTLGVWVLFFLAVLSLMTLLGHGDRISETLKVMIRNTLFFMAGYSATYCFRRETHYLGRYVVFPVLLADVLFSIRYLNRVAGREFASRTDAVEVAMVSSTGDAGEAVNALILHYPCEVLILFMSIMILSDKSRIVRYGAVVGIGTLILVVLPT